jgi:hypothetical protein
VGDKIVKIDYSDKVLGTDPLNPDTDGDGINDMQDKNPTYADFTPSPFLA